MNKGIRQAKHHPSHTTKFGENYTKNMKEGKNTKHSYKELKLFTTSLLLYSEHKSLLHLAHK